MRSSKINEAEVIRLYNQNKSTHEIAESLGTYTNKVRRVLTKHGVKIRGRADAQSIALKSGRAKHPTKGTTRPESVKEKISEGIHNYWQEMSDDDYQARVDKGKEQWDAMSKDERDKFLALAAKAVRKAAEEGSKIEKFVKTYLTKQGFVVIFHQKNLVANENLEIDLYVPELKTCIEIDGPAHFYPIWGEESLKRHIKSDAEKAGLLLAKGFCILRVKNLHKNVSNIQMRTIARQIEAKLLEIKKKYPAKNDRYIQLEV